MIEMLEKASKKCRWPAIEYILVAGQRHSLFNVREIA